MSAVRFDILPSALQTATGAGGAIPVIGLKELTVYVDLTAHDTLTRLDVYLQSSSDGGTTWYDLPCRQRVEVSAAGTGGTPGFNVRNILDNATAAPERWMAKFREFGDLVRAAWILNGTSVTMSVKGIGK